MKATVYVTNKITKNDETFLSEYSTTIFSTLTAAIRYVYKKSKGNAVTVENVSGENMILNFQDPLTTGSSAIIRYKIMPFTLEN